MEVDVELFDIETKGSNNYHTHAPLEHMYLTFIVWHLNSVFVLRVWNFLCDGPLNRCMCLTMNFYKSCTKGDEILK